MATLQTLAPHIMQIGFGLLAYRAVEALRPPRPLSIVRRKVGGLTFVRLGSLSVSFCTTRKPLPR